MAQPAPDFDRDWNRLDYRIPKQGIPWYVVVLGITAVALAVLTVVGFWIASTAAPQLPGTPVPY